MRVPARVRLSALAAVSLLALGAGEGRAADNEESAISALASDVEAGPVRVEEPRRTEKPEPAPAKKKAARRLGLDLAMGAGLDLNARVIDFVDAGDGGEYLRAKGDVVLTQGTLRLTCDALDAYYPANAEGTPQKIVAEGDVRVVQGDAELLCARAEFDNQDCVAVCTSTVACGSEEFPDKPASLTRGRDSVRGRQIEFNLCTGGLTVPCGARLEVLPAQEEAEAEDVDAP